MRIGSKVLKAAKPLGKKLVKTTINKIKISKVTKKSYKNNREKCGGSS